MYDRVQSTEVDGGTSIIVPTTTMEDADIFVHRYLESCKSALPKLQMGRAEIIDQIYLPVEAVGNEYRLKLDLGPLSPAYLGYAETLSKLML